MKKFLHTAALAVSVAGAASAQVGSINSAYTTTETRSDPLSTLQITNSYPAVTISDQSVSHQTGTGFAPDKTDWFFSNNKGTSGYLFSNNDYFTASMTLTLTATGGAITPRKEAGFLLNTAGGQGQFILDTDAHEIVAFGGPLPFYAFPKVFQSGDTVVMGMTYFLDANNKRAIFYFANDLTQNTGPMTSQTSDLTKSEFTNLEQGIITGSTLGGYEQTVVDTTNPTNGITAAFRGISIAATPEPSGLVALATGALTLGGLALRKRRTARPS